MVEFRISTHKNKKYDVYYNGRWIPYGSTLYEHYKTSDIIPKELHIYPEHLDKKRRRLYRSRSSKIVNKYGELTYKDKNSPNYWAYHTLWN